jgi:diguanylate cyclase (GGDEF)-like protein
VKQGEITESEARLGESSAGRRDRKAQERDVAAQKRDHDAAERDQAAANRDVAGDEADLTSDLRDRETQSIEEIRVRAHADRERAREDRRTARRERELARRERRAASEDRAAAAQDREEARRDRRLAASERRQSGVDDLTGARRRGVGLEELQNEMKRVRREGGTLIAAFVDVDGLKTVNDALGHDAGDRLLQAVAAGLRRHMRSYDLLVRLGGDEFLCAMAGVDGRDAARRFDYVKSQLLEEGASITVGFGELLDGDGPAELIRRADRDLLEQRAIARGAR